MRSKAEEIAQFKSPELKITSVKSEEKKFRIHRSTAVETGIFNVSGTFKGKPFTEKDVIPLPGSIIMVNGYSQVIIQVL